MTQITNRKCIYKLTSMKPIIKVNIFLRQFSKSHILDRDASAKSPSTYSPFFFFFFLIPNNNVLGHSNNFQHNVPGSQTVQVPFTCRWGSQPCKYVKKSVLLPMIKIHTRQSLSVLTHTKKTRETQKIL